MQKLKLFLFSIITAILFITNVSADTAYITVKASTGQVIVGNNVTVTVTISANSPLGSWEYGLNYDQSVFRLISTNAPNGGLYVIGQIENNNTKAITYTYTFSAINKGSSTFSVGAASVVDFDVNDMTLSTSSATVKTITYNEYQASLSKNNNLASLTIEGEELTPEFNKDTLEYNVKVSEDTKQINIKATPEDNTATVNGTGTKDVSPGNNSFEIYVVAQNGSEKVYKVNVEVIDKEPIEVKYNEEDFTVVKIRDNLSSPKGFKESTVNINGFEIPAYYSEIMEITVVGLKDLQGKIQMFTYDNGIYDKYEEINIGNLTIRPLPMEDTLEDYVKSTLIINNITVECLEKTKEDRYKYIYGVNVETNEKGLYTVDTKDTTIMKFDKKESVKTSDQTKMLFYTACSFAGTTLVSFLVIFNLLGKNNKRKKKENAKEEISQINCPKCGRDYDIKQKTCPYCAEIEGKNSQEEEVYDLFEEDKKKKKHKKKHGKEKV